MKTLGLIGGISYHSTAAYYKLVNEQVNELAGANHAAKLVLYSVNYNDFKHLQSINDWKAIATMLSDIAIKLENVGADCIVLCCNTAHKIAADIKRKINIPFLHIADETAKEIDKHNLKKVALLGTKFIMEDPFFSTCIGNYGIDTILPGKVEQEVIHDTILNELAKGFLSDESRNKIRSIIQNLKERGAEAVILGCTELGLFLQEAECEVKFFDTVSIHAKAAVDFALSTSK